MNITVPKDCLATGPLLALLFLASPANAQTELYTYEGGVDNVFLGFAAGAAGDLDGDGVPDFLIGVANGGPNFGGSALAISGRDGSTIHALHGTGIIDCFGCAVSGLGDLDGDGRDDFGVGANAADDAGTNSGSVSIFSGSDASLLYKIDGPLIQAFFGASILALGDVDADGVPDFLVGASNDLGPAGRGGSITVYSGAAGSVIYKLFGDNTGDLFGISAARIGDLDLDGIDDFAVGAPSDDDGGTNAGSLRVYSGTNGALLMTLIGDSIGIAFGQAVAGPGDLNGDGVPDILVGSPEHGPAGKGRASAFSGVDGSVIFHAANGQGPAAFGWAVDGIGDIDGDGLNDVVVGAREDTAGGPIGGSVWILSGLNGHPLEIFTGSGNDQLGSRVVGIGDLNGSGSMDLLATSPGFNGQFDLEGRAMVFLMDCPDPETYCTGKLNSAGCVPFVTTSGVASRSVGEGLIVQAADLVNQTFGLVFWSTQPAQIPFFGGTLCVAPSATIRRTPVQNTGGSNSPPFDCSGSLSFTFSADYLIDKGLEPGTEVYVQVWARDPGFGPPDNVAMTDAASFVVCH